MEQLRGLEREGPAALFINVKKFDMAVGKIYNRSWQMFHGKIILVLRPMKIGYDGFGWRPSGEIREDRVGKVKAIIFDVYQTLLDNDTDEEREDSYFFLSRWLSFQGVTMNPADLRGRYLELCHEEISRSPEPYPDIDIGKVFSRILADHTGQGPPPAALVSEFALLFRISTTNHLAPFPGVIPMLERLKGQARIGIASNAQRLFTIPELTTFGMADLFDGIVFSSDIGVCKPHRKIFTTALEAISAEPETTLFVGDNLAADVCGSQSAGMKAIWIDHGRGDDLGLITPDFTVKDHASLTELLLFLLK